jgi:SOS-response transcriptional repressor LexA
MNTLHERFKAARKYCGLTQAQAAQKVGDNQQSVHEIEAEIKKNSKYLSEYADIFGVSREWLILGVGTPPPWAQDKNSEIAGFTPVLEWGEIPEWIKGKREKLNMSIEKRDFIPQIFRRRKNTFGVRIKNDSMISPIASEVSFIKNSILICEKFEKVHQREFLIIKNKKMEEPIFRMIVNEGGILFLKPLNPHYPIQEFSLDWEILATVIARLDIFVGEKI